MAMNTIERIELYNRITKLSNNPKLSLGIYKEDFVTEVWLMLQQTEYSKLTDAYIKKVMIRQRYCKSLPIYKKLFNYNDNKVPLDHDIADI